MTHDEKRLFLIRYLLNENPDYSSIRIPDDSYRQWRLLRSLMNVRPAKPIGDDFLSIQDEFFRKRQEEKESRTLQACLLSLRTHTSGKAI